MDRNQVLLFLISLSSAYRVVYGSSIMINMEDLFVNRTHFGYGDHYVYSTTSPLSFALYVSVLVAVVVISCSIWIYARPTTARVIEDSTKKEVLLGDTTNPYARVDELLDQFHREVTQSEVLIYDEENPEFDNNSSDCEERSRKRHGTSSSPCVVNGFYSLTHDDPTLDYNEDMYLEFVSNHRNDGGCYSIQGYGKYDTGNVRVGGLVASTGEAYWYEVPYEASPYSPPVVLARGTFSRHDSGTSCFTGQWFRSNGEQGGTYRLFSHKVVFPSCASNSPSVAGSMTTMECSFSGSVLGDISFTGSVIGDDMDAEDTTENGEATNPPVLVALRRDDDSETEMYHDFGDAMTEQKPDRHDDDESEASSSFQSSLQSTASSVGV